VSIGPPRGCDISPTNNPFQPTFFASSPNTSFHYQPEAQHPKSSAIHSSPAGILKARVPVQKIGSGIAAEMRAILGDHRSRLTFQRTWKPQHPGRVPFKI
jgi:hypothetical protein